MDEKDRINREKMIMKSKRDLQPAWLTECVMYDRKTNSLIIAPYYCQERGISNLVISHSKFGSRTMMRIRVDWSNPKYDPKGNYKQDG